MERGLWGTEGVPGRKIGLHFLQGDDPGGSGELRSTTLPSKAGGRPQKSLEDLLETQRLALGPHRVPLGEGTEAKGQHPRDHSPIALLQWLGPVLHESCRGAPYWQKHGPQC